MRKITIAILALIVVGLMIPTVFSSDANSVVITYGETTNANPSYKATVNQFFEEQSGISVNDATVKIITASDVNAISGSISQKTYNSNEIFSCALVDLNNNGAINVKVDSTKITTITPQMYASALKSAGITQGNIYVTSPVTATGESALAGIMNSYEVATDTEIPEPVKEAANDEISTQAQILENNESNVTAEELTELVDYVKQKVIDANITDHDEIVNIIYNYTVTYNINLTQEDIENLAISIEKVHSVQDQAEDYNNQVIEYSGTVSDNELFSDIIWKEISSIFNIDA